MPRFRRLRRPSRTSSPNIQEPAAAAEEATPDLTAAESPEVEVEPDETVSAAPEESTDIEGVPDETALAAPGEAPEFEGAAGADAPEVERRPSRLGRGWIAGIAAALVLLAGGLGAGGYYALRYHHESEAIERNDALALKAAVECVSATQAPDTQAMVAAEQKIIDCGTDAFRSQALLYTNMIVQAYQAANIHVQVSDVRAAVEHHNDDGSIDILVAMRVKVAGDQSQNESGYRLRAKMAFAEGQYRISKLDQVTR